MRISDYLRALAGAGAGVSGGDVRITRVDDGLQVGAGLTDSEGFCDLSVDGAHGNVLVTFRKGSTVFVQDSRAMPRTGGVWWSLLRTALKYTHGAGIIPAWAYGSDFATTGVGGVLRIATGAVMIDGVLACWYSQTSITPGADGDRALVAALSGSGIVQLADIAYSAIDATIHVPLRRYTVASGAISAITDISAPILRGIASRHPAVSSICRLSSGTSSNASGEDSGLSCNITLVSGVTYDVRAKARVISRARDGAIAVNLAGSVGAYRSADGDSTQLLKASHHATGVVGAGAYAVTMYDRSDTALTDWVLQATYGSFGSGTSPNFNTPAQVAVDSSGNIYVADTGNTRLVKLSSAGAHVASITGLNGIVGVCVDVSDNIYIASNSGGNYYVKKYNSSLVNTAASLSAAGSCKHIATDGSYVYLVLGNTIQKRSVGALALDSTFGSAGSGNGQLSSPWGIAYNPTNSRLYVVDEGNIRMQTFTTAGVYQSQYLIGVGSRGVAISSDGNAWVANHTYNVLEKQNSGGGVLVDITQATPDGIAIATGDVIYASNAGTHNIAKWDEATTGFNWDAGVLAVLAIPRS